MSLGLVCVLDHVKRLEDCFGQSGNFSARITAWNRGSWRRGSKYSAFRKLKYSALDGVADNIVSEIPEPQQHAIDQAV
jgi:hypothetical protein